MNKLVATLINKSIGTADTLNNFAIKLTVSNSVEKVKDFDWNRTLWTALIAALIAQGLIILINWIKIKIELNTKKKLLKDDLKNQKGVIIKLKSAFEELYKKFEARDTKTHTCPFFEDLHTDIYESISKTELFKIYGNRIKKIVKIYKTVSFLNTYSVDKIYCDYIAKLEIHLKEEKNNPNHKEYCTEHLFYISIATGQIKNNLRTIEELIVNIDEFIN